MRNTNQPTNMKDKTMTMIATIKTKNHDGKIASNRKENSFYKQMTLISRDFEELATVRFYCTSTRVYCCVWINDAATQTYISGGGYAGGYGYHKASAAMEAALNDAGVTLSESISGRGESAMNDALQAIGVALGASECRIFNAHA